MKSSGFFLGKTIPHILFLLPTILIIALLWKATYITFLSGLTASPSQAAPAAFFIPKEGIWE